MRGVIIKLKRKYFKIREVLPGEKGSVTNYLFYGSTILILLSIPVTIILVRTENQQVTRAAQLNSNFSNPPSVDMSLTSHPIHKGESVTVHLNVPSTNWYTVYFSSTYPLIGVNTTDLVNGKDDLMPSSIHVVYRGSTLKDFSYTPTESGYLLVVTYQLQGTFGDFSSGDIACMWDGNLYIYRKTLVNPFLEFVSKNATNGRWEQLTTCQNSGAHKVEVTQ